MSASVLIVDASVDGHMVRETFSRGRMDGNGGAGERGREKKRGGES